MKTNPDEMPARVRRVLDQFQRWRGEKDRRKRVPEPLWDAATQLCDHHSVHKVSGWLRLNHTSLRDRAAKRRRSIRRSPRFVEWRLPALAAAAPAAEYVVELDEHGARRISVRGAGASDVAALVSALGAPAREA